MDAAEEAAQAAVEQPSPPPRGVQGGGGRGGRGGRRGKRAVSAAPEQDNAPSPRGGPKGKRKAVHPAETSAQQAKHGQHILKRKEKEKALSCPLCLSATILACDKLDTMSLPQLKVIMG